MFLSFAKRWRNSLNRQQLIMGGASLVFIISGTAMGLAGSDTEPEHTDTGIVSNLPEIPKFDKEIPDKPKPTPSKKSSPKQIVPVNTPFMFGVGTERDHAI